MNCILSNQNLNESILDLFRVELEKALNDLLNLEMTSFLKY